MKDENTKQPQETNQFYEDKKLICIECQEPFIFTIGEQKYYISKGLALPKRCSRCRAIRKLSLMKGGQNG